MHRLGLGLILAALLGVGCGASYIRKTWTVDGWTWMELDDGWHGHVPLVVEVPTATSVPPWKIADQVAGDRDWVESRNRRRMAFRGPDGAWGRFPRKAQASGRPRDDWFVYWAQPKQLETPWHLANRVTGQVMDVRCPADRVHGVAGLRLVERPLYVYWPDEVGDVAAVGLDLEVARASPVVVCAVDGAVTLRSVAFWLHLSGVSERDAARAAFEAEADRRAGGEARGPTVEVDWVRGADARPLGLYASADTWSADLERLVAQDAEARDDKAHVARVERERKEREAAEEAKRSGAKAARDAEARRGVLTPGRYCVAWLVVGGTSLLGVDLTITQTISKADARARVHDWLGNKFRIRAESSLVPPLDSHYFQELGLETALCVSIADEALRPKACAMDSTLCHEFKTWAERISLP